MAQRDARVGADPGRRDERVPVRTLVPGGVAHELRLVPRHERVLARKARARADPAVPADVAVDVAQRQLALAQLRHVCELHPEHLARGGEQAVHRSRIGTDPLALNLLGPHADPVYAAGGALSCAAAGPAVAAPPPKPEPITR